MKWSQSRYVLLVLLVFSSQALASPFIMCSEDMAREMDHAGLEMQSANGQAMHGGSIAMSPGQEMSIAAQGERAMAMLMMTDCDHLCDFCVSAGFAPVSVYDMRLQPLSAPQDFYYRYFPSSRSDTPFRPPIFA